MTHKRSIRCGLAGGLLAFTFTTAAYGAGVTLITHGWNSDANPGGWVDSMATQIVNRTSNPSAVTRLRVTVHRAYFGGPLEADVEVVSGPVPTASSASDEIIISVDWSGADVMPYFTTQEVAAQVADLFFNPTFETAFVYFGGPLAERPIHLIGHSRGGSVVTEIARILGESGVWVDQVTTLDPHPARGLYTDADVKLRENVIFADNYYRADLNPFDFNGQSVGYAKNFKLDESTLESAAYPAAHQNVHLWYHGTVDTTVGASDGTYAVPAAWYGGDNPGRFDSGFYFSRLIAGFDARPALGLHPFHGGTPGQTDRYTSQRQGTQWANIDDIRVTSAPFGLIQIGDQMTVTYRFQDFDSGASIDWYLDSDTNPYNTPSATWIDGDTVSATGQNIGSGTLTRGTSGIAPGLYYLRAKITSNNGGHVRYAYAPGALSFATSVPPTPIPTISSISPNSLPGLPLPQTQPLTITGTGFLPQSKLEFFDGTTTYPNRVPTYISPTQLRYNIKVGNVSANWTVKVLNGSLESNPGSFTVTATPDTIAPPAPISPVGYFAGGVGNDFYYVDWTDPADASGLAKIWWKLGSPPTAPNDGVGFALPDLKPLPVSTLTTNPQTLHLWLEDGAGNKDHNQRSSVLLFPTVGAPFVVTPPPDRSVIEGASAVFSVTAGGAAPLGYQWQKNGVNLPGATLPTYVTPPVTLADSGAQFRVILTNAFGAVTSSWATLTVDPANTITWTGAVSSDWNNPTNWSPQTVPTASDRVVINSGNVIVPLVAAFGVMNVNGGLLSGAFTLNGTMNWSNGTLGAAVTVAEGAVLNISGDSGKYLGGGSATARIDNAGIVNWTGGGSIPTANESVFNNLPSGTFNIQNDAQFFYSNIGGEPVFNNAGLVRKLDSVGTTVFGFRYFTNSGVIEVQSGTVYFTSGFTSSGEFKVFADATLALAGGVVEAKSITGAGFTEPRASVSINGTLANLRLINGVSVEGTFTNTGTMTWQDGTLGAAVTIAPGAVLNISGDSGKYFGGGLGTARIDNAGTVNWTGGGSIPTANGSVFNNLPTGTFSIQNAAQFFYSNIGSEPVLNNEGLLRKLGSAGTTVFGFRYFTNSGVIEVQTGTLYFPSGFISSGEFNLSANATLALAGGVAQAKSITGAGFTETRASGTINGTLANLRLINGIVLSGTFTNIGTMNWSNGTLAAAVTVATGAVLNISGDEGKYFGGPGTARIDNAGTVNWTDGGSIPTANGSVFNNLPTGTFNIQNDAQFFYSNIGGNPVFNNAGLLRKLGGSNTTVLDFRYLTNSGVIEVQRGTLSFTSFEQIAGETRLAGGSLSGGMFNFTGGTLSGSGTINASVASGTVVSPGSSPGTLTINGSYTQTAVGILKIEIGGLSPGSQHDQLVVTGPATLDGALQFSFTNGFAPQPGDFFNVLSCASRSGAFAASNAGLLGLTESYTPTGLRLIAGSNAYPSLSFTVAGGPTQTVCVPFQLQAAAADVDGALTNVTILLDGSPLAGAGGSPVVTTAELDFPARYTFTARAQDNLGGTTWATQEVAVLSWPLHWLLPAGFRTNGAFKLCLLGETNRSYELQASTNLSATNWTVMGVMENTNGVWRFLDTGATNQTWRFYRAVQVP